MNATHPAYQTNGDSFSIPSNLEAGNGTKRKPRACWHS